MNCGSFMAATCVGLVLLVGFCSGPHEKQSTPKPPDAGMNVGVVFLILVGIYALFFVVPPLITMLIDAIRNYRRGQKK